MNDLTEEKARRLPAGPELDRICAEWMGCYLKIKSKSMQEWAKKNLDDPKPYSRHWYWGDGSHVAKKGRHLSEPDEIPFSSDWAFCGPLLEAIERALPSASLTRDRTLGVGWVCWLRVTLPPGGSQLYVGAPTPQLAIARACAVLVAQGITVDDLKQPTP